MKKKRKENQKEKQKPLSEGKTGKEKKQKKSKCAKTSEKMEIPGDEEAVLIFRALGDDCRIRILHLLEQGELCGIDLLKNVDVVQSTLSHHLKILMEASLVICRKEGRRTWYSIDRRTAEQASLYLRQYRKPKKKTGEEKNDIK